MRFFNDRELKNLGDKKLHVPMSLEAISRSAGIREAMEDHGRNVGKSHGTKSAVVALSKVFIANILSEDEKELVEARDEMFRAYSELLDINIPGDIREGLICDAEQEVAEALFCYSYARFIFSGEPAHSFNPTGIEISPRGLLAGLLDSVSELSKLMGDYLVAKDLSIDEELAIRGRYVEFGKYACEFLSTFKGVPPTALNASRRPGQGFQSKLVRVESLVQSHQREFLRLRHEAKLFRRLVEVAK